MKTGFECLEKSRKCSESLKKSYLAGEENVACGMCWVNTDRYGKMKCFVTLRQGSYD